MMSIAIMALSTEILIKSGIREPRVPITPEQRPMYCNWEPIKMSAGHKMAMSCTPIEPWSIKAAATLTPPPMDIQPAIKTVAASPGRPKTISPEFGSGIRDNHVAHATTEACQPLHSFPVVRDGLCLMRIVRDDV